MERSESEERLADVFGLGLLAVATILIVWIFDFVNGFHDSANSIATIIATKVLSPIQAVGMAAVFNFVGIIMGGAVAATIQKNIIDQQIIVDYGLALVLSALLGAIIWDLVTWFLGIPTSSSHALVGGLLGAGGAVAGLAAVNWAGTGKTLVFMVLSPIIGLAAGFLVVALVTRTLRRAPRSSTNRWFRRLQLVSSAFYSFTHGTNDAQKGMGIIMMVLVISGLAGAEDTVFLWVAASCHAAISLGTFFGGWRVVRTMASRITKLQPFQGFSAETAAATVLAATAHFGIPVSTTHTISGSIMGVGAARRMSAVRWGVGRRIVAAWVLTIPAAATISGLIFWTYLNIL
jgi:PiT family inorganic phosphate transporter